MLRPRPDECAKVSLTRVTSLGPGSVTVGRPFLAPSLVPAVGTTCHSGGLLVCPTRAPAARQSQHLMYAKFMENGSRSRQVVVGCVLKSTNATCLSCSNRSSNIRRCFQILKPEYFESA